MMIKKEEFFLKRIREISENSYIRRKYTFTGFLSESEINRLSHEMERRKHISYELFGGYVHSERKIAKFGNIEEIGYEQEFPIACIHITPLKRKFAKELSHRDFLGSLMRLGIERNTLGDIILVDKEGYLFCIESISKFIIENLKRIGNTYIKCERTQYNEKRELWDHMEIEICVTSERIDAVLSKVFSLSRKRSLECFQNHNIYVNAYLCQKSSYNLKDNDIVSVRGYGKFMYKGIQNETKKNKKIIKIKKYCTAKRAE